MRIYKKWAILLAVWLGLGLLPWQAMAANEVILQVAIGMNGIAHMDTWNDVEITINNPGDGFAGTLVFREYKDGPGIVQRELNVPKGISRVKMPLAMRFNPEATVVLMRGDVPVAKETITGNYVQVGWVVGLLSDKVDANVTIFSEMEKNKDFQNRGWTFTVRGFNKENTPGNYRSLSSLDALVLNNFSVNSLSKEQIGAIREWVLAGGNLIVAGPGNYSPLADLLPVQVTGSQTLSDLEVFKAKGGDVPAGALEVQTGSLVRGKTLFQAGDIPLVALNQPGNGKVFFVAYDLAAEPLAHWAGNSTFWLPILEQLNQVGISAQRQFMGMDNGVSRFIPGLERPSILLIGLVFAAYLLLVGPLLFWLLKRVDRRDWAWWLIPLTALIFSLGIQWSSQSKIRGDGINHAVSTIQLLSPDFSIITGSNSFVVARSTDLTVGISDNLLGFHTYDQYQGDQTLRVTDQGKAFEFYNIPYRSMRNAIFDGPLREQGMVTGTLSAKDGRITGSLKNETAFDLRDVYVLVGNYPVSLGLLPKGGTVTVDQPLVVRPDLAPPFSLFSKGKDNQYIREQELLSRMGYNNVYPDGAMVDQGVSYAGPMGDPRNQISPTGPMGDPGSFAPENVRVEIFGFSERVLPLLDPVNLPGMEKIQLHMIIQKIPITWDPQLVKEWNNLGVAGEKGGVKQP